MRRNGRTSITSQVRRSVSSIAVLLSVPAVIGLVVMLIYSARTQAMIRRMDATAGMKPALESTIAENLFSVAAGRTTFAESGVEKLIEETDSILDTLLAETEGGGQIQLTIARRTMNTLEQYVLRVRDGMEAGTHLRDREYCGRGTECGPPCDGHAGCLYHGRNCQCNQCKQGTANGGNHLRSG